ncbi:beta-N-acetylhexosaminidase [Sphingomonas bacterium]|uniref:beta-N-acetylhexosaminidase n=1 Tax=Sphingomonas bacterium TaxID=1895847 RepID=UPI001576BEF1|nr:beta-N-acetylhexosaminidase [Sphingomonas bacterium]
MRSVAGLAFALLSLLAGVPARAEPQIIPRPLHVVEQSGAAVAFRDGTPLLTPPGDAEAVQVARYLVDLTRRTGEPRLAIGADGAGPAIRLVRRPGIAPEGYALDIGEAGATITASTRGGLFYGAVSLWQLMTAAPDHRLARVHIEDAPRFRWRGLLLDSARHLQSVAEIERTIDWMALHKLNRLQWHLADDQGWRLQIRRYPRLTGVAAWRTTPPAAGLAPGRYGGFYTQAQVRRLVALAAARNITIVPEIEMPGHATAAILAYPAVGLTTMTAANLGDWGVFPSIYGADARSFAFLHGVLDEVMAMFPSHEIAIGGDEAVHTLWHGSPSVQAQMRTLGLKDENALQAWFVGRIGDYLNAHGRRLVGWDEILADKALARQDIVLSWHGAEGAIAAAQAGHDVVMATAPTLYLDNRQSASPSEPPGRGFAVTPRDIYAYDPGDPPHASGTPALGTAASSHVLGVQGQLWTEHVDSDARVEAMMLPRAAALAEIGWTAADRRDWPDFAARLPAMRARYAALGLHPDEPGAPPPQSPRRVSQQLDLCTDATSLNLEGRAAPGEARAPVYLVTIRNPCWIYRGIAPTGVGHLAVGVAALPFNFQFADDVSLPPPPDHRNELVVRRGCDGPVLATVPLAGVTRDGVAHELVAPLPLGTGRADLCLVLARAGADPLWVLGWADPRP